MKNNFICIHMELHLLETAKKGKKSNAADEI